MQEKWYCLLTVSQKDEKQSARGYRFIFCGCGYVARHRSSHSIERTCCYRTTSFCGFTRVFGAPTNLMNSGICQNIPVCLVMCFQTIGTTYYYYYYYYYYY
jgi:hypothetical protein